MLNKARLLFYWRKWQPTPVLLPGKSHGRRSLEGYSPWGREELDMTERLHSLTHLFYWRNSWVNRVVAHPPLVPLARLIQITLFLAHQGENVVPDFSLRTWTHRDLGLCWLSSGTGASEEAQILNDLGLGSGVSCPVWSSQPWLEWPVIFPGPGAQQC